jgi:Tfp pilus assembly protein PilV
MKTMPGKTGSSGARPGRKIKSTERTAYGFTLLETSIAMVVLMVAALASSAVFAYAINYNAGASDRTASLAVGQAYMERLRKVSFANLASTTTPDTVTSVGRTYSVSTTICSTSGCGGSSTLKIITVSVTPPTGVSAWTNSATTLVSARAITTTGSNY